MSIIAGRVNYNEYILSPEWQRKRQVALSRAGGKCQLCGKRKRLNVHHNTYARLGDELPEDLIVLCKKCHDCFHAIRDKRTQRKARERTGISARVTHVPLLPPCPSASPMPDPASPVGSGKALPRTTKGTSPAGQLAQPPTIELHIDEPLVETLMTPYGGISALGLAILGETWPPISGWRKRAIGRVVHVNKNLLEAEWDRVRRAHAGERKAKRTIALEETTFTDEKVHAIRADFASGFWSYGKLASKYECRKGTIRRVVRDLIA